MSESLQSKSPDKKSWPNEGLAVQSSGRLQNEDGINNKFERRAVYSQNENMAIFKIYSDFFNIIFQDKKKQSEYGIEMIGLIGDTHFDDNITLYDNFGSRNVYFKFMDLTIKMNFNFFISGGEVYYSASISSAEKTTLKAEHVYKEIFALALKESELKGSYLTMPSGAFQWEIKNLEERSMDDIYLPKKQLEDIVMFKDVFLHNENLLRYLLVGVPGTGKTESSLVLMNELKKEGVTIIKTQVCKLLKSKVELAVLLKPSLIVLDDLDLTLGSRNSGSYSNVLQSFLDVLDGTDKLPKDVGIIATTNSAALLDLAAQRPGRFDKVMIFDELTKENITKIILKSLKYKFQLTEGQEVEIFSHKSIVDKFYSSNVTGAHIFNSISMLKLKFDMMAKISKKPLSVKWVLDEIDAELEILEKIKKQQQIKDRLENDNSNSSIGFNTNYDDGEEEIFLNEPCVTRGEDSCCG